MAIDTNIPTDIIEAARLAFEARTTASAASSISKPAAELLDAAADEAEKTVGRWAKNAGLYCPVCFDDTDHQCRHCDRWGWETSFIIEAVFYGKTEVTVYDAVAA